MVDYNSRQIYPLLKTLAITGKKINIAAEPVSLNVLY